MKKNFLLYWILFHALILISFLVSIIISPKIEFSTSLFDILPPQSSLHEVQNADTILADKTGRTVTILVKANSFEKAKSAAARLYSHYLPKEKSEPNPDYFDSLSLYVDSNSVTEITEWLHKKRYFLLDEYDQFLLESGNAQELADDALASVYGAFSISDLSKLEEDPFLISERILKRFLEDGAISATNMSLKNDVLACEKDGDFFVLIRGTISEKGSSLIGKKNTVKTLYETSAAIKNDCDVDFIFSGVPFHSYENSSSAQTQISVISTVALILIVLVFLWIFRSPVPAIVSALAVSFSCAIGFVSTLLFFRGIHVLTFVFGTTLIGTCLDYSIHYFVNWKYNQNSKNGTAVRNHIFRGITLGFISTEICFTALFLAPFPLLKQVSVFLFTGLATAYLSVISLYPLLKIPEKKDLSLSVFDLKIPIRIKKTIPLVLIGISVISILVNYRSLRIKNNIQELYSMSPEMLQNEIISAKILNTGSSGWYFIIKADSEEELLQKNEELSAFLDESIKSGKLSTYLSMAQFIPSQKKQAMSFSAAKKLLPLVGKQFEALGFEEKDFVLSYNKDYDSIEKNITNNFIHADSPNLPANIKEAISNLWIGEVDGKFYSCVLPLHAKSNEEQFFREFAENKAGIFFVNKVKDISSQLDSLSKTMLLMLAIAFAVVILILFFFYKPKLVLKIASIPLLVTLVTTAILLLFKIHLSFFPITALILVFGLGLDYIIYAIEGSNKQTSDSLKINNFAILLSFLTTALSFGALAFSSFPPVHFLGLTVFAGLSTAVVSAFSLSN